VIYEKLIDLVGNASVPLVLVGNKNDLHMDRRVTQVGLETSHNIDCFLGSFCHIRTVFRLNCLTAQPSYEGRAAMEGGK
jgi:GTPase SAR1 family protein